MAATVQAVKLHTPEDVRAIIAEAITIVGELEVDGVLEVPAFEKAVDLLAARVPVIEQQQTVALDPRLIGNGHRPR